MSRQEFLEELRERLLAEGASELVQGNLNYYSSYIDTEVSKGREEAEVLSELGHPSLIARSILDAAGYQVDGIPDVHPGGDARARESEGYSAASEAGYGSYRDGAAGSYGSEARSADSGQMPQQGGNPWIPLLLFIILLLVIVVLVFVGLFSLLSPILVPLLLVMLVVRLLGGGRRRW